MVRSGGSLSDRKAPYSDRLPQDPAPRAVDSAVCGDSEELRDTLAEALRFTAFIVLPAAAGLMVLARPILPVLLKRGSFTAAMAEATAQALFYCSLTLVPVAGVRSSPLRTTRLKTRKRL